LEGVAARMGDGVSAVRDGGGGEEGLRLLTGVMPWRGCRFWLRHGLWSMAQGLLWFCAAVVGRELGQLMEGAAVQGV